MAGSMCSNSPSTSWVCWPNRGGGRWVTGGVALSFMGLATNTQFATDVTLQPLDRYALDAAILFSDILTVPDAMGLGLSFAAGEGPRFARPVRDEAAVAAASGAAPSRACEQLGPVRQPVGDDRPVLPVPVGRDHLHIKSNLPNLCPERRRLRPPDRRQREEWTGRD